MRRLVPDMDDAGVDLLQGLLDVDPNARLTARAALAHPYFDSIRAPLEEELEGYLKAERRASLPVCVADMPPRRVCTPSSPPPAEMSCTPPNLRLIRASTRRARSGLADDAYVEEYLMHLDALDLAPHPPLPGRHGRAEEGVEFVDWLIEVIDDFDMSVRSVFLAVDLAARFDQAAGADAKPSLALLSATCLHVASKCEDISYIGVEDLVSRAGKVFSSRELLDLEERILKKLDFAVAASTTIDFVHIFLGQASVPAARKLQLLAGYLAELSLFSRAFDGAPRRTVAEAIVLYASLFFIREAEEDSWQDALSARFHVRALQPHVEEVIRVHQWALQQAQLAAVRRYRRPGRHVGDLMPMDVMARWNALILM
jgi:hypothetical protein